MVLKGYQETLWVVYWWLADKKMLLKQNESLHGTGVVVHLMVKPPFDFSLVSDVERHLCDLFFFRMSWG